VIPVPKPKFSPPWPFIEVIWDDAASNSKTWVTVGEVTGPEQVITRGWLVKETDSYIAIAGSVPNEDLDELTVGNTMTIPKGMIVSRRDLKLLTARPKKIEAKSAGTP
jgi:hypothetical protein